MKQYLTCRRVRLLTPRDFTPPHATAMAQIRKPHEPPRTKGSFRAWELHLLPPLRGGGGRESQSEVLGAFKLHARGIKLRMTLALHSTAALAAQGHAAARRTLEHGAQLGTWRQACQPDGTLRVSAATSEETKSRCFTKAHFPGLLSKVN